MYDYEGEDFDPATSEEEAAYREWISSLPMGGAALTFMGPRSVWAAAWAAGVTRGQADALHKLELLAAAWVQAEPIIGGGGRMTRDARAVDEAIESVRLMLAKEKDPHA